jgi:hypothetical protein
MNRLEIYLRTLDVEQQVNLLCELLCFWLRIHAVLNERTEDGWPTNSQVSLDSCLETINEISRRLQKAADDIAAREIKLHFYELETLEKGVINEPSPAR